LSNSMVMNLFPWRACHPQKQPMPCVPENRDLNRC